MTLGLSVLSPKSRAVAAFFIAAFLLLTGVFAWNYADAAAGTVVADTTGSFLRFKQGGSADDVLKITFGSNENTETLTSIAVVFAGTAGTPTWTNTAITASELADLLTASGGIQLWKETTGTGFSASADTQVTLAVTPVYSAANTFVITPASAPTIATDDVYYIVLKPDTAGVTNNNAFTVSIPADGIVTSVSSPTVSVVTTAAITMDTSVPTLNSSQTFPATGSANVPIGSFINIAFSEAMLASTLNTTNVSMTAGGTPVSIAIRPMYNSANVIVSSAPTYAANARFATMPRVSDAFFFIGSNGSTITPGGTYVSPTLGDIVFFSHDGFPGEFGQVTTSTMVAGTFAVNGFPLFGQQRIMKIATPTVTGLTTAATSLTTGDLIMVSTTAKPTSVRYGWHLVTTGAAVNNVALRIDGSDAQPTYATGFPASRFSTVTPTATATDNGAAGGGVLAVFQGDLVFAKVGAGEYGWHIATTAGDLSSDSGESTAILDNGTIANSKVTASSVMSKLTPTAQGAVTESATAFNIGDLVFTNTPLTR